MATKSVKYEVTRHALPTPGSVKCSVYVHRIFPPKDPTTKQPYTLSVYFLQDASIPYVEKGVRGQKPKPWVFNPAFPNLLHQAGGNSHYIAKFGKLDGITAGYYTMYGVCYDVWVKDDPAVQPITPPGAQPSPSDTPPDSMSKPTALVTMKCSSLVPISLQDANAMWRSIPFANRSVDVDVDLPNDANLETYAGDKSRKLIIIDINRPQDEPGIYGTFSVPEGQSKCITSYLSGEQKIHRLVLAGGPPAEGTTPSDNHVVSSQRGPGKSPVSIVFMTKLYEDSLLNFSTVHWESLAYAFYPHITGTLIGSIDHEASYKHRIQDSDIVGSLVLGSSFHPDMAETARRAGFDMSWEGCIAFDERLKTPQHLHTMRELPSTWSTAINLQEFTGTAELLPLAMERGWAKVYVVTNHNFSEAKRQGMRKKPEAEIVAALTNREEYPDTGLVVVMYAALTKDAPAGYTITDYLSRGEPKAAVLFSQELEAKRVKIDGIA